MQDNTDYLATTAACEAQGEIRLYRSEPSIPEEASPHIRGRSTFENRQLREDFPKSSLGWDQHTSSQKNILQDLTTNTP